MPQSRVKQHCRFVALASGMGHNDEQYDRMQSGYFQRQAPVGFLVGGSGVAARLSAQRRDAEFDQVQQLARDRRMGTRRGGAEGCAGAAPGSAGAGGQHAEEILQTDTRHVQILGIDHVCRQHRDGCGSKKRCRAEQLRAGTGSESRVEGHKVSAEVYSAAFADARSSLAYRRQLLALPQHLVIFAGLHRPFGRRPPCAWLCNIAGFRSGCWSILLHIR